MARNGATTRPPAAVQHGESGAAAAAPAPRTLAERLRVQLSDDIVRGELAPGVVLDEMELAYRFQVSRTPVREAIRQLGASGLVDVRPHRSAVVARPDRLQVLGMFEALRELEALCAGFAAERMTKPDQGELQRIHRSLKPVVRLGDAQRYHEINEQFHAAIYAGAHNVYLMKLTAETRARITPFSRAQFRTMGRLAKSHAEHEAVLTAICKGQREEAVAHEGMPSPGLVRLSAGQAPAWESLAQDWRSWGHGSAAGRRRAGDGFRS